jgi:hypothetical protein
MKNELVRLLKKAEGERHQLLEKVSTVPAQKFFFQTEKRWSISQILTHLLISEQLSLRYMKKKSLGIEQLNNSGLIEQVKSMLLTISQRLPFKYKAPTIVLESTPPALSLHEIVAQWSTLRTELQEFLNSIEERNIRKKIYKHPIAGRLNASQAVSFFREHIKHHLPQIKRLL